VVPIMGACQASPCDVEHLFAPGLAKAYHACRALYGSQAPDARRCIVTRQVPLNRRGVAAPTNTVPWDLCGGGAGVEDRGNPPATRCSTTASENGWLMEWLRVPRAAMLIKCWRLAAVTACHEMPTRAWARFNATASNTGRAELSRAAILDSADFRRAQRHLGVAARSPKVAARPGLGRRGDELVGDPPCDVGGVGSRKP